MIFAKMHDARLHRFSATAMLLAIVLIGSCASFRARAESSSPTTQQEAGSNSAAAKTPARAPKPSAAGQPSHYTPSHFPKRAGMYYESVWGVDSLSVKAVESGELIRFTYRILDPSRATIFNDKKHEAFLDSPAAHVRLVIPNLEKVGQLRQYNTPVAGTSYWMAFSNPHLNVKRGDRVNVVIGQFHADGLVVQ